MAASGIAVSVSMGVMKSVLEKLGTLMGAEYKKIKGLFNEVSFLRDELSAMEAQLEKMDAADRLDSQDKDWRKAIIDMSYDIEDCIDDFMHHVGGEASNKVGLLQKACGFLTTVKDRYCIANQIEKIKTRVIQTSKRRKRYHFNVCISTPVVSDPRLSTLFKDSTALVGIDTQKEELSKWVNDEEQQLKIMSIVGFGGLGKTTLANEVYRQVEGQFNCIAFVSISQKPDITKLLKRILSKLGIQQYCQAYFVEDDLVCALRTHLQDKRYFIVVDDLWEMEAWDAIECAFPRNNYCSRLMITTRNDKVAKRCCGTSGIIHNMMPLSEPDSRKLFFTRIFGSQDDCPSGFEEVSCAILKSASKHSLDKLRSFDVTSFGDVAHCADALSSLSPPSGGSLERLDLFDWSFSIIPRWIGHLRSLQVLYLGAKQIIQDDIGIFGMLPSLVRLFLRIVHVPTTRIVIGGGLFTALKLFSFRCDGISSLTFEAGSMPNLEDLSLFINTVHWDRATPEGLQHLEGLQQIGVCRAEPLSSSRCRGDVELIKSVFKDIVEVLPTRPVFRCTNIYWRPVEIDDWHEEEEEEEEEDQEEEEEEEEEDQEEEDTFRLWTKREDMNIYSHPRTIYRLLTVVTLIVLLVFREKFIRH